MKRNQFSAQLTHLNNTQYSVTSATDPFAMLPDLNKHENYYLKMKEVISSNPLLLESHRKEPNETKISQDYPVLLALCADFYCYPTEVATPKGSRETLTRTRDEFLIRR